MEMYGVKSTEHFVECTMLHAVCLYYVINTAQKSNVIADLQIIIIQFKYLLFA